MAKVVLDDVVKKFGPVTAVDHLALEVADREFVTLVGPSGCGKTTSATRFPETTFSHTRLNLWGMGS